MTIKESSFLPIYPNSNGLANQNNESEGINNGLRQNIYSLEGIQNFSSLSYLTCSNNSISEVNAVMSLSLRSLIINSNNISNLDFTNNNFY